jgi:alkylation response protein AidB-like acyl-CoA dehydrogenase
MAALAFDLSPDTDRCAALRGEVRAFLQTALAGRDLAARAQSWNGFDAGFSRQLGERGWLGMTWPRRHGGGERSALERYVVVEELLAAGAPVAAHWIAERQSGPTLLRYGTEAQRTEILPRIARGECFFCIGMSEAGSGSDLAAARTRAERTSGGYVVNGAKLWTTNAHRSHYMILFCRTGENRDDRHGGSSQFLVDMQTPGVTVRPIPLLTGEHHFNEVSFVDVFLPDSTLIGNEGQGWSQVTGELAFERSGPDRFLSAFAAVVAMVQRMGPAPDDRQAVALGRIVAHLAVLRRMSRAVAGMLEAGRDPSLQAAVVKDLGATLEQEIPEIARTLFELQPGEAAQDDLAAVLDYLIQHAPTFSLRGGTREILRGIIARGLGLR